MLKLRVKVKKFLLLAVAMALVLASSPPVQAACPEPNSRNAFAFETITVSTVSIGFTFATFAPVGQPVASAALVTIEAQPIRFRSDGVDPTTSVGHVVVAAQSFLVCGTTNVRNLRMIRDDAVDATASVSYYQ